MKESIGSSKVSINPHLNGYTTTNGVSSSIQKSPRKKEILRSPVRKLEFNEEPKTTITLNGGVSHSLNNKNKFN